MTIKPWLERLPVRLPMDQLNCTLTQVGCMQSEINELRAKLAELEPQKSFAETHPANPRATCQCEHWQSCPDCHPTAHASKYNTAPVYTSNCIRHPDAPHGFDRTASHSADRYVCTCQSWKPGEAS